MQQNHKIFKLRINHKRVRKNGSPYITPLIINSPRRMIQLKADALSDYLFDTAALLFIDDAHKPTGRKAQVAHACLLSSKI